MQISRCWRWLLEITHFYLLFPIKCMNVIFSFYNKLTINIFSSVFLHISTFIVSVCAQNKTKQVILSGTLTLQHPYLRCISFNSLRLIKPWDTRWSILQDTYYWSFTFRNMRVVQETPPSAELQQRSEADHSETTDWKHSPNVGFFVQKEKRPSDLQLSVFWQQHVWADKTTHTSQPWCAVSGQTRVQKVRGKKTLIVLQLIPRPPCVSPGGSWTLSYLSCPPLCIVLSFSWNAACFCRKISVCFLKPLTLEKQHSNKLGLLSQT